MTVTIPKMFHFIWLGPQEMPSQHRVFLDSWRENHPDWEMKLWTSTNRPKLRLEHQFLSARSLAGKSDVLRYEILLERGGVYLDTDMECLRNVEELLHGCSAFVCHSAPGRIGTAVFGATPKHLFLQRVMEETEKRHDPERPTVTGPHLFTELSRSIGGSVRIFEQRLFFPLQYEHRRRLQEERSKGFSGSYGVHWFAASWVRR